jgi:luciferase family oxidoreductase group 1
MLGLPYAFASHFAPQMMAEAIRIYRERFQPSEQLDRPYVMLGFNCFAADSDEEAELLSTSIQQAFVALRSGEPTQLLPPQRGYPDTLPHGTRAMLQDIFSCSAIGSPETVRRQVDAFVERTQADELIVTAQIYDHAARLRSYELLMDAVRVPAGVEA